MDIDLRAALVGSDRERSLAGVAVAAGLYLLVLTLSMLPVSVGAVLEPGLVVVGVGLAGWWAYENSGFAVAVALVLFPVLARLTYYSWLYAGRALPVALPLSFGGGGAWEMWVPLAVGLGTVAFGLGVLARWGRRVASGRTRSVA
ncbi:hypothetical protein [Haloglomus litoreum]|uniref:hypothetical protein n=1 Tax=Haloglomus litoreum TaxID=3034026 RepID=UPI0023E8C733|nr:hypothetical protein [Haloglomus sp. DT116]